jgi:predicted PurR-regulated permease PerM
MSIDATFFGFIVLGLGAVFALVSYFLGKRKTNNPITVAVIGGLLGLIPVLGLIFIAVLALKSDIPKEAV